MIRVFKKKSLMKLTIECPCCQDERRPVHGGHACIGEAAFCHGTESKHFLRVRLTDGAHIHGHVYATGG